MRRRTVAISAKIGWTLLVGLVLLSFGTNRVDVVQAQSHQSKLRLRELDIVDEKGRERIVIAAPLPEAVVDGKVGYRVRVVSAAVQFIPVIRTVLKTSIRSEIWT